ncbi:LacI family DNA-binding transcriptional regulator [Niameybacter massiliensis]|uniref:LacI family DNA-binding transcriptional regulator n=1 Tax=Niameybacter massiliensis TaxID=1658108 RepID=UPI0006B5CCB7|nr:LacI family DNA-binding transcriptional regulator [Niameybacter massiliensis]
MAYTIADIAKITGVSKATVSRVINNKSEGVSEETKKRILKTIKEVGYRPNVHARSVAGIGSKMIGVIIPDITNPFFPQLVRGIDDYLSELGYTIFLCNSDNDPLKEEKYLLSFIDKRVDGIILATGIGEGNGISKIKEFNIPIVLADRVVDRKFCDASVCVNNISGAISAMEYFIKNNKKSIAFLGGEREAISTKQRLEGYKIALEDNKIKVDNKLIRTGEFSVKAGYKMTYELLKESPQVDAIFAACDMVAIGSIKAIKALGKKVPEDIEIIGFDGIELSEIFEPSVSTVIQPIYEMAVEISKMLVGIIENSIGGIRHIVVEPTLELRNTTKSTF